MIYPGGTARIHGEIRGSTINNGGQLSVNQSFIRKYSGGSYTWEQQIPRRHSKRSKHHSKRSPLETAILHAASFLAEFWEEYTAKNSSTKFTSTLSAKSMTKVVATRETLQLARDRQMEAIEAWQAEGSHKISDDCLLDKKAEVDALRDRFHKTNGTPPIADYFYMAWAQFCLLTRKNPTILAMLRTISICLVPTAICLSIYTTVLHQNPWWALSSPLLIPTLYLLFYPFESKYGQWVALFERRKQAFRREHDRNRRAYIHSKQELTYLQRLHTLYTTFKRCIQETQELERLFDSTYISLLESDWRSLRDVDFEQFLKKVLEHLGYKVKTTKVTGDQGVDLIAIDDTLRIAIQAKGYQNAVSNDAVQQVVAGMAFYDCQKSVVITNSSFTRSARDLARKNDCLLVDGSQMERFISGKILNHVSR